jgi:hypothetical protein
VDRENKEGDGIQEAAEEKDGEESYQIAIT